MTVYLVARTTATAQWGESRRSAVALLTYRHANGLTTPRGRDGGHIDILEGAMAEVPRAASGGWSDSIYFGEMQMERPPAVLCERIAPASSGKMMSDANVEDERTRL